MKAENLTEDNVLSIWLGNIDNFGDVDDYIWESFERDFGFSFTERSGPEADACEQPTSVRELLSGFSFSAQWIENAVAVCAEAGWASANCAIVFFNVRYQPSLSRPAPRGPVKFVGNVEWVAS